MLLFMRCNGRLKSDVESPRSPMLSGFSAKHNDLGMCMGDMHECVMGCAWGRYVMSFFDFFVCVVVVVDHRLRQAHTTKKIEETHTHKRGRKRRKKRKTMNQIAFVFSSFARARALCHSLWFAR